jgi:hypothetical protein
MIDERMREWAMPVRTAMHELKGTFHSLRVDSREVERKFLPRPEGDDAGGRYHAA